MLAQLKASEAALLKSAVRINVIIMAVTMGALGGAALWLATYILVLRGGEQVGKNLSLLSVFLAGYSVTGTGAWIGFGWGFVLGAISGGLLYWGYARALKARIVEQLVDSPAPGAFQIPTFRISGNALGIGLGSVVALQLVATTSWLIVRGTAQYSQNAALLSNYLPGYSVTPVGGIVGGAELFALVFVASHLFSAIYNFIAGSRAQ